MIYWQQSRFDEAIREFQAALRLKPDYADAHDNLGLAYQQQGRLDEAIREFQAALRLKPDDAEHTTTWVGSIVNRTASMRRSAVPGGAADQPRRCRGPRQPGLGYEQGRTDEAIWEYQAALRADPDHAVAHCNLGWTYG